MAGHRDVRINMRRVEPATASALIAKYTPYVQWIAGRTFGDTDDLVQVGRIAVIEAHLSWLGSGGASRKTWTRRVVRWRVAEAAQRARDDAQPDEDIDRYPNGLDPEEAYVRAHARESVGMLSHRQRNVIDARLRGHTFAEIRGMIGVSAQQAEQDEKIGFARLRTWANKDADVDW